MPIQVEANLRIPKVTLQSRGEPPEFVQNADRRFTKIIDVPAIPKPGDHLQLAVNPGMVLDCAVIRADWSDDRNLFVVSCTYAKRSMPVDEYHALVSDTDWTVKQLL